MKAIGIDIGGTRVKAGLVDATGAILWQRSEPTPDSVDGFRALLGELVAGEPDTPVGVGCKGIINYRTTGVDMLPGTLHFLQGLRLRDLIPTRAEVRADNDARVALLGEAVWGAARGKRNAFMLTLGTGVGGAAIAEGRLMRGVGGVGAHLGHITVKPDGPFCICGNRGCLETVCSSKAIEAAAFQAIHSGCHSLLRERFAADPASVTCKAVFEAAAEGDAIAGVIVGDAVRLLGGAVAGLLHVFDPEVAIIGGQVSEAGEALFAPLCAEVGWRTRFLLGREIPIVPPLVPDRSGISGAAALHLAKGLVLD